MVEEGAVLPVPALPEPAVAQKVLPGWPRVIALVRSQRTGLFSECGFVGIWYSDSHG